MAQTISHEILQAALDGLRIQEERIQGQIAEVESMLGGTSKAASRATSGTSTGKRGKRSPAARKRMAEAQRLRWAKLKGTSDQPAATEAPEPAKTKRRMSKEGRAAIVAALKKRWALKKAAAKQATAKKSPRKTGGKKAAAKKSTAKTPKKVAAAPASSVAAGV